MELVTDHGLRGILLAGIETRLRQPELEPVRDIGDRRDSFVKLTPTLLSVPPDDDPGDRGSVCEEWYEHHEASLVLGRGHTNAVLRKSKRHAC